MTRLDDSLLAALLERGVSRRSFLKFSAAMASCARAAGELRSPNRGGRGHRAPAAGHLAARPGLRRQHRGVPARHEANGLGARPGPALDRLPRDTHGPERRRGDPCPDNRHGEVPGRVPRDRRGRDPDRGRWGPLHHRRPSVPGHRAGGLRRGSRDDRRRLVRVRRRHPGRARRSDRSGRRGIGDRRRAAHRASGLPSQHREPDGHDRPLPDLQGASRPPTVGAGRSSRTAA